MFDQILARIRREYKVLNRIEISKSALLNNYSQLSPLPAGWRGGLNSPFHIAPVLKSNAYGHGIFEVARILDKQTCPFFCVDSLYEAYQIYKPIIPSLLQRVKVKTPILIMGYTNPANLKWKKLPFQWALWDLEFAKVLNDYQKGSKVHIFVDTGMHREGITLDHLAEFTKALKNFRNLEIVGLMSHLAGTEKNQFDFQIQNFKKAKEIIKNLKSNPTWFHISASDPLLDSDSRKKILEISNLARVGKALYGIAPSSTLNLKPVLKLKTHLVQIKTVKKGDFIGYVGTYIAKADLTIGILPIGYNDGVDRRLSNIGTVKIDGIDCPIIGRVSMNLTTIDLSKIKNPMLNQEVLVYSDNPEDLNSVQKVANLCKTVPHEILIREVPTTRRVVVE